MLWVRFHKQSSLIYWGDVLEKEWSEKAFLQKTKQNKKSFGMTSRELGKGQSEVVSGLGRTSRIKE